MKLYDNCSRPADEDAWFRENGPATPALLRYLEEHGADYDLVLFFAFRYYTSYFGLPIVREIAAASRASVQLSDPPRGTGLVVSVVFA